jgi:hypothetical protein
LGSPLWCECEQIPQVLRRLHPILESAPQLDQEAVKKKKKRKEKKKEKRKLKSKSMQYSQRHACFTISTEDLWSISLVTYNVAIPDNYPILRDRAIGGEIPG